MHWISHMSSVAAAAVVTGMLAGCATSHESSHKEHDKGSTSSHAPASMKDMQAMCDMHKKMMSAKTPSERQAMMEDHMKRPEMREHLRAIEQHCK